MGTYVMTTGEVRDEINLAAERINRRLDAKAKYELSLEQRIEKLEGLANAPLFRQEYPAVPQWRTWDDIQPAADLFVASLGSGNIRALRSALAKSKIERTDAIRAIEKALR